ncbi:hypothetical protein BDZ89DRAFT_970972 [Hymenopellis radicata]|nr:hypothetical protein BDZ89DRAFT_970972 [Hymenopellis radicata]
MRSGHGYPLWIPEPDAGLPVEYQREGVTIGDLGLLTAGGGFDFILNVHLDAHHPVNAGNVPPDFMPLPLRELGPNPIRQTLPMHRPEAAITSSDVSRRSLSFDASAEAPSGGGFGIEFSTARTQAAILMLPTGANRYDAKNRGVYEKYAARHAKSWYQYVNGDLGRMACSGTLYLVTGCDKCLSWARRLSVIQKGRQKYP